MWRVFKGLIWCSAGEARRTGALTVEVEECKRTIGTNIFRMN